MGAACCKRRVIQGDFKSGDSLQSAKGQLWSAKTKQADNKAADPAAVKAMVDLYNQCKGDVAELAKKTGSNPKLLKANPPKDANDFAHKLVTGAYSH